MSYIGVPPQATFSSGLLDRFTSTTGTTVTLTHDIASENDIVVFVNFVKQDSTTYSVGGTGNKTLTLGGTLVSSDIVEVHYLNIVGQTNAPSAGSVTTATINDLAVTGAKLNTDVISAQTELATAPAATDELLVSDAGVLKRVDVSLVGGNNTPAFIAYRDSSAQSLSDATETTIIFNATDKNEGSCYDTSNGRFTPTTAGTYYLGFGFNPSRSAGSSIKNYRVRIYKNGSTKQNHFEYEKTGGTFLNRAGFMGSTMVVADGSSDYFTVAVFVDVSSGTLSIQETRHDTFFCGFRIIGA